MMIANESCEIRGLVHAELWRNDSCIVRDDCRNGITNQGKNTLLDAYFNSVAEPANWYIGIIDNENYSVLAASDTLNNHPGWQEWQHTEPGTRVDWSQGVASGQQVSNPVVLSITLTAVGIIQGIFVTSGLTKGSTVGVLWSTALFTVPLSCESGDVLKLSYIVQL